MGVGRPLLIVDGDAALRQTLAEQLEDGLEFAVTGCATAAQALVLVAAHRYDAILSAEELPDGDGRALCRALRDRGWRGPILLLVGATPAGGAPGQDSTGVTDHLAKPFRLGTLLTVLRAHLRASGPAPTRIGPYLFQPDAKLLVDEAARRRVRLTEKETGILEHLSQAGGKIVARETLLGAVWGYNAAVDTHTLETHVYRLRQKIERDPAHAEILVTEPGGYRLVA